MNDIRDFDVIVIGSYSCDLVSFTPRYPLPGESVRGTKFITSHGGKGSNQAVQCAKLGAKVAMVCKVGDDFYGHQAIKTFKDHGINGDMVLVTTECATGVASITVCESGESHTVITLGANLCLNLQDLNNAESYLKRSKILLCQFGISKETNLAALRMAKKFNVIRILNAAPVIPDFDIEFLKCCEIICVNKAEAESIAHMKINDMNDAQAVLNYFHSFDIQTVLITLGEKGCIFSTLPDKTLAIVESVKSDVVDTTGAGDSFIGALAYYLSKHTDLPLEDMVRRSCTIAAQCVGKPGTQKSYFGRNELPDHLFN